MTLKPMSEAEMLTHAGNAIERIDRHGERGAMQVTTEETIALAMIAHLHALAPAQGQLSKSALSTMNPKQETAS
ncbi:MAG: hypothetical protein ACRBB0_25525 [Pelagimonas sp.]|uniref:hypothetical protein n=1 Tax=Pelagimonas sp. TaxID=2073170 RepID=UPI003D6B4BBA